MLDSNHLSYELGEVVPAVHQELSSLLQVEPHFLSLSHYEASWVLNDDVHAFIITLQADVQEH